MPKLMLVDDLFTPSDAIVINYSGSNTFKATQIIKPLMEKIVQVESKDTFERIFKWDITNDPRAFYDFWHCIKEEDKWTSILIKVTLQGTQHTQTRKGNLRIEMTGFLQTNYEYSNSLQKLFWMFYNKTFYYKRRRQYLERGKEYVYAIRDELYRELKIPRG